MNYKIAYLTSKDPLDKKVSSGVYYYQSKSLSKHCGEVHYLGPVKNKTIWLITLFYRITQRLVKRKIYISHNILISRIYGRIFSKKLKNKNYDFVFADKSSREIAFLKTDIPIIYSTDATFASIINYYPQYSNLSKRLTRHGNIIEKNAIDNSVLVICTSQWAADSVIRSYKCVPSKVHTIPRGANIDKIPDKELINQRERGSTCRLLFMGTDWRRKGYEIAFKTMNYIRSRGIKVQLTTVGFIPPNELRDEDVLVIPYIDKNNSANNNRFDDLFINADFFLLPTRSECLGISLCESAAYGLPVITTDTGGITEIIKNGINGYALPLQADFSDYGDLIIRLFEDKTQYEQLSKSSREYFESRLNWDVWGEKMKTIMDEFSGMNNKNHN